jgi:hypothetical protein
MKPASKRRAFGFSGFFLDHFTNFVCGWGVSRGFQWSVSTLRSEAKHSPAIEAEKTDFDSCTQATGSSAMVAVNSIFPNESYA